MYFACIFIYLLIKKTYGALFTRIISKHCLVYSLFQIWHGSCSQTNHVLLFLYVL